MYHIDICAHNRTAEPWLGSTYGPEASSAGAWASRGEEADKLASAHQLPTFQTFFLYSSLNIIFTPYTIWVYGIAEWSKMLLSYQGLCYLFFAIVDVEANFLVIRAYGYTDMLSCMLLDAW